MINLCFSVEVKAKCFLEQSRRREFERRTTTTQGDGACSSNCGSSLTGDALGSLVHLKSTAPDGASTLPQKIALLFEPCITFSAAISTSPRASTPESDPDDAVCVSASHVKLRSLSAQRPAATVTQGSMHHAGAVPPRG